MSSAGVDLGVFGQIPTRSRPAFVASHQFDRVDVTVVNLLTIDFVLTVMGQKIAIPLGPAELELVGATNFAIIGVLLYTGKMTVSAVRLFLYLLTFGTAFFLQAFSPRFNIGSLLLSCTVALPFLAVASVTRDTYLACLKRFQVVALCIVGLVFLDHATQLVGLGMPDIEKLVPERLLYTHYVYIQPLHWQSSWNKPNAFFFLEASYTSQFIAMALILELALFQRFRLIVIFGVGLMAVFAGTGIVLVLAAAPVIALKYLKPKLILLGMLALAIGAGVGLATGYVDVMSSRTEEFDKSGASGHARFVAPFESIGSQFTEAPTRELFFGQGPGSQDKSTTINLIPVTKIILEYGLIVVTFYAIYVLFWIFGSGAPFICSWAVFVYFFILSGGSSQPLADVYSYLLVGAFQIRRPAIVMRERGVDMIEAAKVHGSVAIGSSRTIFG